MTAMGLCIKKYSKIIRRHFFHPTHSPKFSGVIVSTSASGYRLVNALVTRLFFFGFHLNSNALIFEPQTSR